MERNDRVFDQNVSLDTDLDGTLLDHDKLLFSPRPLPPLAAITAQSNCVWVLNTSKTAAELRAALGQRLRQPYPYYSRKRPASGGGAKGCDYWPSIEMD